MLNILIDSLLLFFNTLPSVYKLFAQIGRAISSLIKVEKQIILGKRKEWVFPSYSRSKPQNGSILRYFYTIKSIGYH